MSQLWGNTFLCFCSVAGGASHQRPLLLREEWGKKQGEMRGNEDSDQAQWDLGRRRLWGQERSWGVPTAAGTRGRRCQSGSHASAHLPLPFQKTQGENNNLFKSTNLLVPSWGSLPHRTQADKAAVSSRCQAWAASPGRSTCPWPVGLRVVPTRSWALRCAPAAKPTQH